jgi:hypothetical protein
MASAKRAWQWVVPLVSVVALAGPAQSRELGAPPSPLLAIDQNRVTVAERIVSEWGDALVAAKAGVDREQLRALLLGMRADQLLAASLAGSLEGLRNAVSNALLAETEVKPSLLQAKALGDTNQDVVYVPVTPCRLVDTRGTIAAVYQTGGAYASTEVRTYKVEGGNGVCLSQLPASVSPTAVQIQVFALPTTGGSGDVEMLPQGSTFGATATLVFLGNVPVTTVSTTTLLNLANKMMSVQVRGGGLHLAIDVVGYFRAPAGGYVSSVTAGTGLTGGGTGAVNLAVNTSTIQSRVSGTCAAGSSIRAINANGTVTCETDDVGAGTVTSVGTGSGLTGGPITASGTINLAATQLLPTTPCTNGFTPAWNGSAWTCSDPSTFAGNINLPSSTSASAGNIVKGGARFVHDYGGTFVGLNAGNFTTTATGNVGVGQQALAGNTSGEFNTAVGLDALSSNTIEGGNTAVGSGALASNTANGNSAFGWWALLNNTYGNGNTAIGTFALRQNVVGLSNTAVGNSALIANAAGNENSALGNSALGSNIAGESNTAIGYAALGANDFGGGNTATGWRALLLNNQGNDNSGFGREALYNNTTGNENVATGVQALYLNSSGSSNTAHGAYAGSSNLTGSSNSYFGFAAQASAITSNATAIGANAIVDASNRVRIGNASVTQIGGQVAWTNLSDRRDKKDVRDTSLGLDFVMSLRPVEYRMRNGNDRIDLGFIAQEVEALVGAGYNVLGIGGTAERKLSLRYTDLIAPMAKAIQQQQAMIAAQRAEIAELRTAVEMLVARIASEGALATAFSR